MSIEKHVVDGLYVRHQLNCESYIQTSYGLFVSNMLITGDHRLSVYFLKKNHVPTRLQVFGVTDASIAFKVTDWFDYGLKNGYVTSLKDLFPKSDIVLDFDREVMTDQLEIDVAELQSQVTALDATFSTDIERQAAVTNLQSQVLSTASVLGSLLTSLTDKQPSRQNKGTELPLSRLRRVARRPKNKQLLPMSMPKRCPRRQTVRVLETRMPWEIPTYSGGLLELTVISGSWKCI